MNPEDADVELSCQHKNPQTTSDNGLQQRYDQHHPQEGDKAEIESFESTLSHSRNSETSLQNSTINNEMKVFYRVQSGC